MVAATHCNLGTTFRWWQQLTVIPSDSFRWWQLLTVTLVPIPGTGPGSRVTWKPKALMDSAVLYTSCMKACKCVCIGMHVGYVCAYPACAPRLYGGSQRGGEQGAPQVFSCRLLRVHVHLDPYVCAKVDHMPDTSTHCLKFPISMYDKCAYARGLTGYACTCVHILFAGIPE